MIREGFHTFKLLDDEEILENVQFRSLYYIIGFVDGLNRTNKEKIYIADLNLILSSFDEDEKEKFVNYFKNYIIETFNFVPSLEMNSLFEKRKMYILLIYPTYETIENKIDFSRKMFKCFCCLYKKDGGIL